MALNRIADRFLHIREFIGGLFLYITHTRGQSGQGHFGQNRFCKYQTHHYNINIYIYIIVSKIT